MNKRIKELIEQAYEQKPLIVANPTTFEIEHKIGHGGVPMYHKVFNEEKFAKLIVRECAKLAKDKSLAIVSKAELYAEDAEELDTAKATAWQFLVLEQEIKQHFGIE